MDRITLARMGVPAVRPAAPPPVPKTRETKGPEFGDLLRESMAPDRELRFSAHALARLESRGIELTPTDRAALARGLEEVSRSGAREAVLLQGDRAFVVNVPKGVVITAHASEEARMRVYTGIDAAVVV